VTTTPIRPEPQLSIDALHLCITQTNHDGESRNVHLIDNDDLGVFLMRGQQGVNSDRRVPEDHARDGLVVLALGIDNDHDEVHYYLGRNEDDAADLLGRAIEALEASRESLIRIQRAGTDVEKNAFQLGRDYERGVQGEASK
jgi:hypothetical protein